MTAPRFLFGNLTSGSPPSAEVLLSDYEYGRVLAGIGSLRGKIKVAPDSSGELLGILSPMYTRVVVVERGADGSPVIVWDGMIWDRPGYDAETGVVSFAAAELFSAFKARLVTDDLTFTGVGRQAIAADLVAYAQGHTLPTLGGAYDKPQGELNIVESEIVDAGVAQDLTITVDQARNVADLIATIARNNDEDGGFDFTIESAIESVDGFSYPVAYAHCWAPRRNDRDDWAWDHGRNVTAYNRASTGVVRVTRVVAVGSGNLRSIATIDPFLTTGALSERIASYKDVDDQATLDALAAYELAAYSGLTDDIDVTLTYTGAAMLPSVGDTGQLIIPPDKVDIEGIDNQRRVAAWTVAGAADSDPHLTLTLIDPDVPSRPPIRAKASDEAALADLASRLDVLETFPGAVGGGTGIAGAYQNIGGVTVEQGPSAMGTDVTYARYRVDGDHVAGELSVTISADETPIGGNAVIVNLDNLSVDVANEVGESLVHIGTFVIGDFTTGGWVMASSTAGDWRLHLIGTAGALGLTDGFELVAAGAPIVITFEAEAKPAA